MTATAWQSNTYERNRTARPGTSIAEQSIQKMNQAVFDKLDKLFRNAHAIANNNRPFSDYVWMATLDERKGLFLGETYRNEKACKEFIHSIANMEKDKVTAEMKDVKFITVVSDGSTDVSVSENEMLPARNCERGFSAMKLIKTDVRNRLTVNVLTDVLRIKLMSPSISDFEPTDAIHAWNVTGHRSRRPNYQTYSCSSSTLGHARVSDSESQGSSSDEGQ